MSSCLAIAKIDGNKVEKLISGNTSVLGGLNQRQIDEYSSFDLGSITKVLSTTSILMKFVETGKLGINDKVSKFLPTWKLGKKSEITLRHLLSHNSGLPAWRPLYISCSTVDEVHNYISQIDLEQAPGKKFIYSDLGFITLGRIIEIVESHDLENIFFEIIAKPLSLASTRFGKPADLNNVVATSIGDSIEYKMVESKKPYVVPEHASDFARWRSHVLSGEINDGNSFHCFSGIAGHAGLFSNLRDLISFTQELNKSFKGEGFFNSRILDEFLAPSSEQTQGLGFKRWLVGPESWSFGHFGFPGTGFAFHGPNQQALIYLTNRLHTTGEFKPMVEIWDSEFKDFSMRIARGG